MNTIKSLRNDLERLKVDPSGILMVHVSYKAIGETEGRGDAVLDCLSQYMENGLFLMGGHTYENVNDEHPVMDARNTPVCVGVLPELFRRRPGVRRSLHPTHSICGLGRHAAEFLTGDHLADTPCGLKTAWRRLYEQKAQILLIGVRFDRNTFIHGIEEWYNIPGRVADEPKPYYVIDFDGVTHFTPQRRHCYGQPSKLFESENAMLAAGAATEGKFGNAACFLCDAKKLSDTWGEILAKDPDCWK